METQANLSSRQIHARLSRQNHARLTRLWELTEYLGESRRGYTVAQLLTRIEVSRATIYRDIEMLESVKIGLERETVNGEVRYRLSNDFPLQRAALMFARMMLTPVAGSSLMRAFDGAVAVSIQSQRKLRVPSTPPPPPTAVMVAEGPMLSEAS